MKMRRILIYELLILIPTLVVGAALFGLLRHERDRLDRAREDEAEGRASLIARSLGVAFENIRIACHIQLLNLSGLQPEARAAALRNLEERDPRIRHAFIADPERGGLLFPSPAGRTEDEVRFAQRYDALFSGREPFRTMNEKESTAGSPPSSAGLQGEIRSKVGPTFPPGGCIPWFWENRLHWLDWVRPRSGPVYGVELESAAVLAELLPLLHRPPVPGLVLVIRDANGHPFHQLGAAEIGAPSSLLASAPVGPGLPHWTVEAYSDGTRAGLSGGLFFLLTSLLVLIVLTAMLAGGWLLALQARRDRLDAERKTTFVSNVSHEFKTPLTTLRMYAELLAEGRVKEPEAVRRSLGVMIRETERLTRLVNNVLDFSRLEQGRRSLHLERLDAAALTLGVLEAQAPRLREAGLELTAAGFEAPAWVRTDRDALAQILLNLLDNAIKYAAGGGHLFVTLNRREGRTRLLVEDRGPGIAPAHRPRLFEPFHRADDSLTATKPGTGLGLSISRRLLRDMGGDLAYEPAPDGGARFIMELPDENEDHPDR